MAIKVQEMDKNYNQINYDHNEEHFLKQTPNHKITSKNIEIKLFAKKFVDNLLKEGSKISCDHNNNQFINTSEMPPKFYNEMKFKRGQEFFHKNIMSMFFSKLLGLITILSISSILKILIFTKLSNNPFLAYKRYLATLFHMYIWYTNDLSPGSKLWQSLSEVKGKHKNASKRHDEVHHIPITQKDMALTQFGFMGFALIRPKEIGIHNWNYEDWDGFIHIWKVIGHLLGIEDRFNICRDSVNETKEICEELVNRLFEVEYGKKDPDFLFMSTALINGMWCIQPFLNVKVILAYIYNRLLALKKNNSEIEKKNLYMSNLSKYETYYYKFIKLGMLGMQYNILRLFANFLQHLALWFMHYFPFLAYYKFGFTNSRVKILN